ASVVEHGAGPALCVVAAHHGAGLAEHVAQVLHQQQARFDVVGVLHTVDGEGDRLGSRRHLLLLCRVTSRCCDCAALAAQCWLSRTRTSQIAKSLPANVIQRTGLVQSSRAPRQMRRWATWSGEHATMALPLFAPTNG